MTKLIENSNWVFTVIFIGEASLKLVAYGKKYFNNSWNKFDFFVVVMSLFDLVIANIDFQTSGLLANGP